MVPKINTEDRKKEEDCIKPLVLDKPHLKDFQREEINQTELPTCYQTSISTLLCFLLIMIFIIVLYKRFRENNDSK